MTTKTEVEYARKAVSNILDIILLIVNEPVWSKGERLQEINDTCTQLLKEINEAKSIQE